MIDIASIFLFTTLVCCGQPGAAAPELAVKGPEGPGVLVFAADAIEFRAARAPRSRRWPYAELREIRINGPKELELDTYETWSRPRFGLVHTTTFKVTERPIDAELVAVVLMKAVHGVRTSVLPPALPVPIAVIPASHRRFGTARQGTIEFSAAGLLFRSAEPRASRFWRMSDLQSVARLGPSEFLVTAYEAGDLAPYTFELKTPWPPGTFDTLWRQLNPSQLREGGER